MIKHVYLYVGRNMDIQIQRVFELELYPQDPVLPIYYRLFGTDRVSNSQICTIGLESNPSHMQEPSPIENPRMEGPALERPPQNNESAGVAAFRMCCFGRAYGSHGAWHSVRVKGTEKRNFGRNTSQ